MDNTSICVRLCDEIVQNDQFVQIMDFQQPKPNELKYNNHLNRLCVRDMPRLIYKCSIINML